MNKKLESFLKEQNFTVEENGAYGYISDYQIAVGEVKGVYGIKLPCASVFSHLNENEILSITDDIKSIKKECKIFNFEVTKLGVFFSLGNNKYANLLEAVKKVTGILKEKGTPNKEYCPFSGEALDEATKKKIFYNQALVFLNESSVQLINAEFERQEQEYQNAPNNYLKGTLGAIVGGALGAIVWVVVGALFGFLSGWIAFLIAFLAGVGYDKMKGKANYTKFIVSSLVTLVYIIISMFLMYVLIVRGVMNEAGMEGNPVSLFIELLSEDADIRKSFLTDMVLGLAFGIFGIVFSYLQMKKTLHQKQEQLK